MQAAISYANLLVPNPGESRDEYASELRAIASEQWGEELRTTVSSWSQAEGDVAVLRYKVLEFSRSRAFIALWLAAFLDAADGAPGAVWGRSFVDLVWEDQQWKVAREDGDAGPVPASLGTPSAASEVAQLLEGFQSLD